MCPGKSCRSAPRAIRYCDYSLHVLARSAEDIVVEIAPPSEPISDIVLSLQPSLVCDTEKWFIERERNIYRCGRLSESGCVTTSSEYMG